MFMKLTVTTLIWSMTKPIKLTGNVDTNSGNLQYQHQAQPQQHLLVTFVFQCPGDQQGAKRQSTTHKKHSAICQVDTIGFPCEKHSLRKPHSDPLCSCSCQTMAITVMISAKSVTGLECPGILVGWPNLVKVVFFFFIFFLFFFLLPHYLW